MEFVKTVYQGGFDKHDWYSVFNNYGKRLVSHVYSKSFVHSSAALASQSQEILHARLLPLLDESSAQGVDVHSLFPGAVMDLISAYCFGLRGGSNFIQGKAYRDHWLRLYKVRKANGFFKQELPRLSRALQFFGLDPTPSWAAAANKELEAWCKGLSDSAIAVVRDNTSPASLDTADDPVVVRSMLSGIEKLGRSIAGSSNSPAPSEALLYSTLVRQRDLSVASEIFDHLLAGQETTGVTLTYLAWHLSRAPGLQSELRAELSTLTPGMRRGADGRAAAPDPKQLDGLPLLHAVIIETVRRYAPAGGPEPRLTPAPSSRVGPYEIPGSVRISASGYNLHRDERYYPGAETWDHTRWLPRGGDEKGLEQRHRQFWGFSSGGRMCLGSNFAMYEMKLLVAAVYSNFATYIVNDDGIEPTDGYTAHPKSGQLWLRFERII
ncbi:hypothetical protein KJ359_000103 [Pestalotiopsis sp. 9143b]|nr:hypothetical protein KJ359_000103 [Pestalotiopsis sp. 9143b]